MPALERARAAATAVRCKGRLRTMGVGTAMYQNAYAGYYPVDDIWPGSNHPSPWPDGTKRYRFAELLEPFVGTAQNLTYTSAPDENIFMCPANGYSYSPGMTWAEMRTYIYATGGGAICGNYWTSVFYGFGYWNPTWGKHYLARNSFPRGGHGNVLLAGEVHGITFNRQGYVTTGIANNLFIHAEHTNVLLADGHVEDCPPEAFSNDDVRFFTW